MMSQQVLLQEEEVNMCREQKLLDICFQLVSTAISNNEYFQKHSQEDQMKWVAEQLDGCGFYTEPVGASWGVLTEKSK